MVVAGLVMMASAWLPPTWRFALVIGAAVVLPIVAIGYSWVLYRRLQASGS